MIQLIILLGIVSFFADITYEGTRSIIGPFFALLGATGAIVGTFGGLAEFAGYGIRLLSGVIADKSKNYWTLTMIGYISNLVVVPLFALAGSWQTAALLLVLERAGKAVRSPSRDAMLSYACHKVGRGWGFGLHEAFDRCGGLLGPLLMFWILSAGPHFKMAFALLAIPAAFALGALYIAYRKFPHPDVAEPTKESFSLKNFSRPFWIFIGAAAFFGAGTLNFAFVSFHLQKQAIAATNIIPLFYAGAIAISALFALIGGKWFEHAPKPSLYFGIVLGCLSPLFLLLGREVEVWIGVALWGVALGTQNALFRSVISCLIPPQQRSTGYGIFGIVFGLSWFLGGALIGTIYDLAIALGALTSFVLQVLALPLLKRLKIEVPPNR